jgi:hypothetical protein
LRKYYRTSNRRAFYEKRFKEQDGRCAICGHKDRLVVDHNHATGLMRGLLCYTHNTALGMFRDSPKLLRAAAEYLETHSTEPFREVVAPGSAYAKYLLCNELIPKLLNDESFPSDRARARALAAQVRCLETTAQTRLRRARKKLFP